MTDNDKLLKGPSPPCSEKIRNTSGTNQETQLKKGTGKMNEKDFRPPTAAGRTGSPSSPPPERASSANALSGNEAAFSGGAGPDPAVRAMPCDHVIVELGVPSRLIDDFCEFASKYEVGLDEFSRAAVLSYICAQGFDPFPGIKTIDDADALARAIVSQVPTLRLTSIEYDATRRLLAALIAFAAVEALPGAGFIYVQDKLDQDMASHSKLNASGFSSPLDDYMALHSSVARSCDPAAAPDADPSTIAAALETYTAYQSETGPSRRTVVKATIEAMRRFLRNVSGSQRATARYIANPRYINASTSIPLRREEHEFLAKLAAGKGESVEALVHQALTEVYLKRL